MCTVTYLPCDNGFYLTSNRDEKSTRLAALPPAVYFLNGNKIIYPKDAQAGGTWIALKNNTDALCLLNALPCETAEGNIINSSRGQLLLSLAKYDDMLAAVNDIDMHNYAPFCLIIIQQKKLWQLQWDAVKKTLCKQNETIPQIWSSSTLYNTATIQKREEWFAKWLTVNKNNAGENIVKFHRQAGDGNAHTDVVIKRPDGYATVSITAVQVLHNESSISYHDMVNDKIFNLSSQQQPATQMYKSGFFKKSFFIRLRHWEYWSFAAVYTPIYFYWFYLCIKARSFFFFAAANPTIKNGGFLMESKYDIFKLMQGLHHPHTLLIPPQQPETIILKSFTDAGFSLPVIVKPDVGGRGTGVKKITSIADLLCYIQKFTSPVLIQEFVSYTNEAGIFYYRYPGEEHGRISGIVKKELLTITGDGEKNILQLLQQSERTILQIPALKKQPELRLDAVLKKGEEKILLPYGNHCRGAKFTDAAHWITPAFEKRIDDICCQIPGFYYGRLDVKYKNEADLMLGINISIIELNGAGSEPAHIYDPRHSIFFAWGEIIRHWKILYTISTANHRTIAALYLNFKQGIAMFKEEKNHQQLMAKALGN